MQQNQTISKASAIRKLMDAGLWQEAIKIAARLLRLDRHRCAILDAHGAYTNPRFFAQIGKDVEVLKVAGRVALVERFGE